MWNTCFNAIYGAGHVRFECWFEICNWKVSLLWVEYFFIRVCSSWSCMSESASPHKYIRLSLLLRSELQSDTLWDAIMHEIEFIFLHPQIPDLQILSKPYINGKIIYSDDLWWCINLNFTNWPYDWFCAPGSHISFCVQNRKESKMSKWWQTLHVSVNEWRL